MSEVAPEAGLFLEPIILGTMDVWTMDFSDFCCLPSLFFAAVSELSGGKPRQLLQRLGRFVPHSQGHTGFFFHLHPWWFHGSLSRWALGMGSSLPAEFPALLLLSAPCQQNFGNVGEVLSSTTKIPAMIMAQQSRSSSLTVAPLQSVALL